MAIERPVLCCADRRLELGSRTFVMGILNVTPDSFSDGGRYLNDVDQAVERAEQMLMDGADVIDVGGESTRPGALAIGPDEESRRVIPVLDALARRGVRCLSLDTRNAATARRGLDAGAVWINDVSALTFDPDMAEVCRRASVVVLMHARGTPASMQSLTDYSDGVVSEVQRFLQRQVDVATNVGIEASRILVDPGIGFAKTLQQNLELTRSLVALQGLSAGVLFGPSRKRFLGELTGENDAAKRDAATHGAVAFAVMQGADIVRVHDVKGATHVIKVLDALSGRR